MRGRKPACPSNNPHPLPRSCEVTLDATSAKLTIEAGSYFDVPGNSGFTIAVNGCICEYICSFLPG